MIRQWNEREDPMPAAVHRRNDSSLEDVENWAVTRILAMYFLGIWMCPQRKKWLLERPVDRRF